MQIAQYFFDNFRKIKSINDIKDHFGLKIVDVTEEKEQQYPELLIMNNEFPGQKYYDFSFRENDSYWGELSEDFIDDILKNVRCQLFTEGLISNSWDLDRQYQSIFELFSNNFGKPEELDFSSILPPSVKTIGWIDTEANVVFTLRISKNQPMVRNYISFSVEQKTDK